MTRVASSIIGTPVTLLIYGTVREARGLTSITYGSPRQIRSWMLTSPRVPSASEIAVACSMTTDVILSLSL